MKIKDRIEFKTKAPVMTFRPNDRVIVAVKAMAEKNYGASVIVDDDNKPVGVVTERDFMRRLLAKGLDVNTTAIAEIMTANLKTAAEDDDVLDWLRIMSNERFRHLPIVDGQGRLVSLMSQGDFVSYTWPQLLGRAKDVAVKNFMERFHLHMIIGAVMIYSLIIIFMLGGLK